MGKVECEKGGRIYMKLGQVKEEKGKKMGGYDGKWEKSRRIRGEYWEK